MNANATPIARSPRLLRQQMLRDNRFLGLHQIWFAVLLTPGSLYLLRLFSPLEWEWLVVPGFLIAWLLVELLFLPRRLAIRRLAVKQSYDEVVREALHHGVALQEVRVIDRAEGSTGRI
ncbi:hypothetical protein [Halomonas sp. M4R1S46]|uniref:hypothetical protein n=1 Tax=Halomonas sp. M4R1S46 TaxID=2982692 RepID=UPI0021E45D39|nr:hypothetical protein [Halomonas sp. M4R1S46]UYG06090.1 hypothetical protein OCT48_10570 [Halomonas sp. M4R1S46]